MSDLRLNAPAPPMRIIEISPSALLAAGTFGAMVFIPYLGSIGALLFLMGGAALILRQPRRILAEHLRHIYIYLLPVFCAISLLWSDVPSASLRFSIQLGLTFAIATAMACKVRPAGFVKILFAIYIIAALASLGIGRIRFDGAWLGVFGSKNAFAAVMGVFVLLAASFLFDRRAERRWRLTALICLPIGFAMLVFAQSAGALIITSVALLIAPFLFMSERFSAKQKAIIALFAVLSAILVLMVLFTIRETLFDLLLERTGKDVTLTGRTDLWDVAFRLIAERPLLGIGYQAFWVRGNPDAEVLWAMFGIEQRSGFNFHNTYINNAVEIGLIGVAIQCTLVFGALWYSLRWALAAPSAPSVFYAVFMAQLVMTSFVELVVFTQFNVRSVMTVVCLIHAWHAVRSLSSVRSPESPSSSAALRDA